MTRVPCGANVAVVCVESNLRSFDNTRYLLWGGSTTTETHRKVQNTPRETHSQYLCVFANDDDPDDAGDRQRSNFVFC